MFLLGLLLFSFLFCWVMVSAMIFVSNSLTAVDMVFGSCSFHSSADAPIRSIALSWRDARRSHFACLPCVARIYTHRFDASSASCTECFAGQVTIATVSENHASCRKICARSTSIATIGSDQNIWFGPSTISRAAATGSSSTATQSALLRNLRTSSNKEHSGAITRDCLDGSVHLCQQSAVFLHLLESLGRGGRSRGGKKEVNNR